jgi:hypothetical protein
VFTVTGTAASMLMGITTSPGPSGDGPNLREWGPPMLTTGVNVAVHYHHHRHGGCGPGSLLFSAFGNQLWGAGHVLGRHDDSNAFSQLPLWFHATCVVS